MRARGFTFLCEQFASVLDKPNASPDEGVFSCTSPRFGAGIRLGDCVVRECMLGGLVHVQPMMVCQRVLEVGTDMCTVTGRVFASDALVGVYCLLGKYWDCT